MTLMSTRDGHSMTMPATVSSAGLEIEKLDNTLLVQGAFGMTGLYPLAQPEYVREGNAERHCNMYFVRISASEATREKNPVVTEKTTYVLRYQGESHQNEAMCGVCINRDCPANRNPQAVEAGRQPGLLVLPLG
ncbi:hypothetical protein J7643_03540 [bacterium]|nr:hypothetical protein [bacterium]